MGLQMQLSRIGKRTDRIMNLEGPPQEVIKALKEGGDGIRRLEED